MNGQTLSDFSAFLSLIGRADLSSILNGAPEGNYRLEVLPFQWGFTAPGNNSNFEFNDIISSAQYSILINPLGPNDIGFCVGDLSVNLVAFAVGEGEENAVLDLFANTDDPYFSCQTGRYSIFFVDSGEKNFRALRTSDVKFFNLLSFTAESGNVDTFNLQFNGKAVIFRSNI